MALPNAKNFKALPAKASAVATGVRNAIAGAVGNVGKSVKEVAYNVTEPRRAKQFDKDRAAIKLARAAKGMSMSTAVKNGMYDVANAMTDTARIKRDVAKRKAKAK